jgi:glycosyltransferase involved in cell wall biosynthesis
MIGGTQPGFETLYREIVARAGTLPSLVFHGPVPYHAVNEFYERAAVFVNTSDSEGFPNSYLQAWARGTPVVAFFDPDGVIAREGLGYVASDLDDMRAAIARLLASETAWSELSERCRRYMEREYSEKAILAPYLAAVRQ